MKKLSILFYAFICTIIISSVAFSVTTFAAGGAYVSDEYIEMEVGETYNLVFSVVNAAGNYTVSSDGCVSANGGDWIEDSNNEGTAVVIGVFGASEGDGNVYINVDIATFDNEELDGFVIPVHVSAPRTEEPIDYGKHEDENAPEPVTEAANKEPVKAETKKTEEPLKIVQDKNTYTVLSLPVGKEMPEGFSEKEVEINGKKVKVLVADFEGYEDFYYIYASKDGKEGYYSFDNKEKTIQRVSKFPAQTEKKDKVETKSKISPKLLIIGLVVLAVIIIVLVILLIITKKKLKESYEDDY